MADDRHPRGRTRACAVLAGRTVATRGGHDTRDHATNNGVLPRRRRSEPHAGTVLASKRFPSVENVTRGFVLLYIYIYSSIEIEIRAAYSNVVREIFGGRSLNLKISLLSCLTMLVRCSFRSSSLWKRPGNRCKEIK